MGWKQVFMSNPTRKASALKARLQEFPAPQADHHAVSPDTRHGFRIGQDTAPPTAGIDA